VKDKRRGRKEKKWYKTEIKSKGIRIKGTKIKREKKEI
jgi:hypothetical protein